MRLCVYKFTKTLEEKKHALKTFTNGHLENYLYKEGGGYLLKGGTHYYKCTVHMWSFRSATIKSKLV